MTALRFYLDWELNCQFAGPLWAREKQLYRDAGVAVQLISPSERSGDDLLELVLADDGVGSLEENLIMKAVSAEDSHFKRPFGVEGEVSNGRPIKVSRRRAPRRNRCRAA